MVCLTRSIAASTVVTTISQLLGTRLPIIQAGMIWASGADLAGASARAGCLGVLGAGSMTLDVLRDQILKARAAKGDGVLALNVPLLYEKNQEQLELALSLGLRVFITSAGSPKKFTPYLKARGATVLHVTSTPDLARKCEAAGVDAVIAEGFEAGGHNGRDELTTLTLVPQVVRAVRVPVIAAGGIGDGRGIAAALALGAQGVQMGTRFAMTQESSLHPQYKNLLIRSAATDTVLALRKLVPVRLVRNKFAQDVLAAEGRGATEEELTTLLGRGRARLGMHEGDLDEGELEIGQIVGLLEDLPTVAQLVQRLEVEYREAVGALPRSLDA